MWKAHYGNYGNLLSRIFGKNFVKAMVLLKKLLNSWFDESFVSVRENFSFIKRDHDFYGNINIFPVKSACYCLLTKEVTKELLSRNIFSVKVNFSTFFSACQILREINFGHFETLKTAILTSFWHFQINQNWFYVKS